MQQDNAGADPMIQLFAEAERAPSPPRESWAASLSRVLVCVVAFASLALIIALATLVALIVVLVLVNPENWFGGMVFVRDRIVN